MDKAFSAEGSLALAPVINAEDSSRSFRSRLPADRARRQRPAPTCALITGASQGLGRAFVEECASRGMDLLLVALPGSGLEELSQDVAERWEVSVHCLEADLTDPSTDDRLLSLMHANGIEIDLLVNNAGIGSFGSFAGSDVGRHQATVEVNVLALMRLTHLLIPELTRRGYGWVLNVASLSAFFPMPVLPIYSATKSFVVSFSLTLRDELAGSVGVSVLCPNTIRAPGLAQQFIDRLGLHCRLACLYPEQITREALDGLVRGRAVIVPGWINRVARALGVIVPRALVFRLVRRYWGDFAQAVTERPSEEAEEEAGETAPRKRRFELQPVRD